MAFLLGFIPTVRGLIVLLIGAAIGAWLSGNRGAAMATTAIVALAFLRPSLSMWLESVLFGIRTGFALLALFKLLMALGPIHSTSQLVPAAVFGAIAVVAQLRIWWLLRRGEICPVALGTTRLA